MGKSCQDVYHCLLRKSIVLIQASADGVNLLLCDGDILPADPSQPLLLKRLEVLLQGVDSIAGHVKHRTKLEVQVGNSSLQVIWEVGVLGIHTVSKLTGR